MLARRQRNVASARGLRRTRSARHGPTGGECEVLCSPENRPPADGGWKFESCGFARPTGESLSVTENMVKASSPSVHVACDLTTRPRGVPSQRRSSSYNHAVRCQPLSRSGHVRPPMQIVKAEAHIMHQVPRGRRQGCSATHWRLAGGTLVPQFSSPQPVHSTISGRRKRLADIESQKPIPLNSTTKARGYLPRYRMSTQYIRRPQQGTSCTRWCGCLPAHPSRIQADAVGGLTELMALYPETTRFFINAWTLGYEEIYKAVARAFGAQVRPSSSVQFMCRLMTAMRTRRRFTLTATNTVYTRIRLATRS